MYLSETLKVQSIKITRDMVNIQAKTGKIIFQFCLLLYASACFSQTTSADEFIKAKKYVEQKITHSRNKKLACEMCISGGDTVKGYAGYDSLPVTKWSYQKTEKHGTQIIIKKAVVYLLNPNADLLSDWIVNACVYSNKKIDYRIIDKIIDYVDIISGYQFPVNGIVYEDMGNTGYYNIWPFRDGVTVHLDGFSIYSSTKVIPTMEQVQQSLSLPVNSNSPYATGKTRLLSTTPYDYYLETGIKIRGTQWLDTVKKLYVEAWKTRDNKLMDYAVKWHKIGGNYQLPGMPCKKCAGGVTYHF